MKANLQEKADKKILKVTRVLFFVSIFNFGLFLILNKLYFDLTVGEENFIIVSNTLVFGFSVLIHSIISSFKTTGEIEFLHDRIILYVKDDKIEYLIKKMGESCVVVKGRYKGEPRPISVIRHSGEGNYLDLTYNDEKLLFYFELRYKKQYDTIIKTMKSWGMINEKIKYLSIL